MSEMDRLYVSSDSVLKSIAYFKSKRFLKPGTLGLFFLLKLLGLKKDNYIQYDKWGNTDSKYKRVIMRNLYDLSGIFDAEHEVARRRCAKFVFAFSPTAKSSDKYYNGGTEFSRLGSRICDTLDNSLVGDVLVRNTSHQAFVRPSDDYLEKISKYLNGKVDIALFAAWYYRFTAFLVDSDFQVSSARMVTDMCILLMLKALHCSVKEYECFFNLSQNIISFGSKHVTGDEIRSHIDCKDSEVNPLVSANRINQGFDVNKTIRDTDYEDIIRFLANKPLNDEKVKIFLSKLEEGEIENKNTELPNLNNGGKISYESSASRVKNGQNIILYGVPGSGKSYTIETKYCSDKKYIERVVFHPDYTYSDFIGQILPQVNSEGQVKYKFQPGPFTVILSRAWNDSLHMYYLVVEELNRGNAPAIFGDIFQLLDREEDGSGKYHITNLDVANYVWKDEQWGNKPEEEKNKISIPSNLTILATMNTSDQNVFTLDNAFQRRWKMRLIHNNFTKDGNIKHDIHIEHEIKDTGIRWGDFAKLINSRIAQNTKEMIGSEDKRLGVFFVTDSELDNREDFAEKVLKYLWDDALKMDRSSVFNEKFATFEDLIDAYLQATGNPLKEVLVQELFNGMSLPEPETSNS